jgi:hypothetical protein
VVELWVSSSYGAQYGSNKANFMQSLDKIIERWRAEIDQSNIEERLLQKFQAHEKDVQILIKRMAKEGGL